MNNTNQNSILFSSPATLHKGITILSNNSEGTISISNNKMVFKSQKGDSDFELKPEDIHHVSVMSTEFRIKLNKANNMNRVYKQSYILGLNGSDTQVAAVLASMAAMNISPMLGTPIFSRVRQNAQANPKYANADLLYYALKQAGFDPRAVTSSSPIVVISGTVIIILVTLLVLWMGGLI